MTESARPPETVGKRRRRKKSNPLSARGRLLCRENLLILLFLLIGTAVWAATAGFSSRKTSLVLPPGQLIVAMLDIHQGDSIFIQTPDMFRVLVDAGPAASDRDSFSSGRDKLIPFFREHEIDRLDAFIMSHAHEDHIGGLAELMKSVDIDRIYDPGFAYTADMYFNVLSTIEKSDGRIDYQIVHAGDTLPLGNRVLCQVLSPPRPFISGSRSDCNSNSTVLRIAYGNVSFLLMGDSEEDTERLLADHGRQLHSTFLKVAHHGSRYSSSPFFLSLVQPLHALISCGRNNAFGHPHEETLQHLRDVGATIHRTDLSGDIFVITDGEKYKIIEGRGNALTARESMIPGTLDTNAPQAQDANAAGAVTGVAPGP